MSNPTPAPFTELLDRHRRGEEGLQDELLAVVYRELRKLAAHYMNGERAAHTLQPTALVHEAWMRFSAPETAPKNRAHFMALAAGVMKEILIDHARRRQAAKRGNGQSMVSLNEAIVSADQGPEELLGLCDCLEKLKVLDPRQAQLVELKVFGGLNFEEAAEVMGVSLATAKRDWVLAKAWLFRELS